MNLFKPAPESETAPADMSKVPFFQHPVFPVLASIFSGLLLALCFPPYGKATLAFVALVPLMYAVQSAAPKKAAWLGVLSGFSFFMVSLSWLHNLTQTVAGPLLKVSALLGYGVLAAYCALFFIPFAVVSALGTRRWAGDNVRKNLRLIFSVTAIWVGSEYLRAVLFTGFPWNPLGVSQYTNLAVIQIAEWGGVYLVSAVIVWMNAAIFVTFRQYTHGTRVKKYRPHMELMLGLLPIALAVTYGMNTLFSRPLQHESVRLALVQPNIAQAEKWDAAKNEEILERLEDLTSKAARLEGIDLMIWPETALPDFFRVTRSNYELIRRMTASGIPLLAGSMDVEFLESGNRYYNSSILFDSQGALAAKYDKQHLVPFGEYVPLPGLMRKFTPIEVDFGKGRESVLMPLVGAAPFSVLICFEDTIAPLAVKAVRAGARWLVNQTNDAWFDPSAQSEQHLAHAVFRCVENRVPMARCCNTGVTCIIDSYGAVNRKLNVMTEGFTVDEIFPSPEGQAQTVYTRWGNAFAKGCLLVGATVLFVLRRLHRRTPE